jgi:hypothetical protein
MISLPRSSASAGMRSSASGLTSSSRPGQGPKKVDRVARYQQMQQSWSQDK